MNFNLLAYVDKFPEVCQRKFRKTYDFAALEQRLSVYREAKRMLTAKDVARIFDPESTPFARYWPRPQTKVLEEALAKERIRLAPLTGDGAELVQHLLAVFHNLGTTSIILQFVYPERFAIFSTPVIYLLQVTAPVLLDLYMGYCRELTVWRDHFRLSSVAATGTALWTYAECIQDAGTNPASAQARQEFEDDIWIQQRRVAQVIRPFLRRYGRRLELARILVEEDAVLAGMIAAQEYERLLRIACQRLRGKPLPDEKGAAEKLIEDLANRDLIRLEDRPELTHIWETRNRVVHPDPQRPEAAEVERMIDWIERICRPWGESSKRFGASPSSR